MIQCRLKQHVYSHRNQAKRLAEASRDPVRHEAVDKEKIKMLYHEVEELRHKLDSAEAILEDMRMKNETKEL
jgi:hypothetical protein